MHKERHTDDVYESLAHEAPKAAPLEDMPLFAAAMEEAQSKPAAAPIAPPAATRRESYEQLRTTIANKHEQIIALLREKGPLTTVQIAEHFGVSEGRISGRIAELQQENLVVKSGEVLNRKTNRHNSLWMLK